MAEKIHHTKLMMCVSDDNGCAGQIGKIYRISFRKYPEQNLHHRQIIWVVDVQLWGFLDAFIDIPHGEK
jgi:hypothetical protein